MHPSVWGRLAVLGACLAAHDLWAAGNLFSGGTQQAKGVAIYVDRAKKGRAGVIRIDALYKDYRRKGFFRVGLLPVAVAEGVTVEVVHEPALARTFSAVHEHFGGSKASDAVEVRRLAFTFPGETAPRLAADTARPGPGGRWRLSGHVTFTGPEGIVQADHGELLLLGPQAGHLTLHTPQGTTLADLFPGRSPTQPPPQNQPTP